MSNRTNPTTMERFGTYLKHRGMSKRETSAAMDTVRFILKKADLDPDTVTIREMHEWSRTRTLTIEDPATAGAWHSFRAFGEEHGRAFAEVVGTRVAARTLPLELRLIAYALTTRARWATGEPLRPSQLAKAKWGHLVPDGPNNFKLADPDHHIPVYMRSEHGVYRGPSRAAADVLSAWVGHVSGPFPPAEWPLLAKGLDTPTHLDGRDVQAAVGSARHFVSTTDFLEHVNMKARTLE